MKKKTILTLVIILYVVLGAGTGIAKYCLLKTAEKNSDPEDISTSSLGFTNSPLSDLTVRDVFSELSRDYGYSGIFDILDNPGSNPTSEESYTNYASSDYEEENLEEALADTKAALDEIQAENENYIEADVVTETDITAETDVTAETEFPKRFTVISAVSLRTEGNSTTSTVITTVPAGTTGELIEYGEYWSKLSYEGTIGYISNAYLTIE